MLIQLLENGIGNGTATILTSIAIGANKQGLSVLFVVPTNDFARRYKKIYNLDGVDVIGFSPQRAMYHSVKDYSVICMDMCDGMIQREGDPVRLMENANKARTDRVTIIAAR